MDIEKLVKESFKEHWKTAIRHYPNLKKPKVIISPFEELGSIAGYAMHNGEILLNDYFLETETKEMLSVILPHEISHIIQIQKYPREKRHHGQKWRKIMREVYGLKPCAYHTFNCDELIEIGVVKVRKKVRFLYTCKCENPHKFTTHSHEKLKEKSRNCKICNVRMKHNGKTEIIY